MRVLHVFHTTVPDTSGYSIRSKYITDLQQEMGLELTVVTSCRHPGNGCSEEVIDGIRYYRTDAPQGSLSMRLPMIRERSLMTCLRKRVRLVADDFQPDIIHAHSPVLCGIPALSVARELNIPFVYEVRDLWENASVDKGKFGQRSVWYRLARSAETSLLRKADAVVTICHGLGKEIRSRGIPDARIWLAPNGVDHSRFFPIEPDPELLGKHRLTGCKVIGYIGSFFRYEGLDLLVSAMPLILAGCPNTRLLLVGGGDEDNRLKKLAAEMGISDKVVFTGRIPHQQVPKYCAISDVLVYPRIDTPTTRLTTPLKPLEAMAMGKAVIGSSVAAMNELISDGSDGLLFNHDSVEHLAACCLKVLQNDALRQRLGSRARETVLETRDWRRIIQVYPAAYRQVIKTG